MKAERVNSVSPTAGKGSNSLKVGEIVRVKTLGKIDNHRVLIEFKGGRYIGFQKGRIDSEFYIARVLKVVPELEIKFLKSIGNKKRVTEFTRLFSNSKKEFIQNLINSDNFLVGGLFKNLFKVEETENYASLLRNLVKLLNIKEKQERFFNKNGSLKKDYALDFIIKENISNFFSPDNLSFVLPVSTKTREALASFEIIRNKEESKSFLIDLYFDDGDEIIFLVFVDHEVVNCSISSESKHTVGKILSCIGELKERIKKVSFGRKVYINMIPYEYMKNSVKNGIKTVDIRM